jgi:hypothetical protein
LCWWRTFRSPQRGGKGGEKKRKRKKKEREKRGKRGGKVTYFLQHLQYPHLLLSLLCAHLVFITKGLLLCSVCW